MRKFRNNQAPRQTRGQTKKQAAAVDLAANKKGDNPGGTTFNPGEISNGTKTSLADGVKPGMVNHWIIRSTKSKDLRKSKRQTTIIHGRFKLSGPTRYQKGADTEGEKKKNKPGGILREANHILAKGSKLKIANSVTIACYKSRHSGKHLLKIPRLDVSGYTRTQKKADVVPEEMQKKQGTSRMTSKSKVTFKAIKKRRIFAPGEKRGFVAVDEEASSEEMEEPAPINLNRYLQSIENRVKHQLNKFPKIAAAITEAKENNLNATEEYSLLETLKEELENSSLDDYLQFVASLIDLTEETVEKIFGFPAIVEGHCTVEMKIQDHFSNEYPNIEEKLENFSDTEIMKAFEKLGFNKNTAERLSTERPCHLSLLDIAQIYVEDIFDYNLLLLSGELPGSPFKDEPVTKLYWSKKTGETKKLNCMNFDHDCPPEDIESELLELKNATANGDSNEDELWYHGTTTQHMTTIFEKGIQLKKGRENRDFSHEKSFYIAKEFKDSYEYAKDAHKSVALAFMVFQVPKDFFGSQSSGWLLSEEEWRQAVCYFKSGEECKGFVKSYTGCENEEERKKIFWEIEKKMSSEKVTFIRGPFSQWSPRGGAAKKQQPAENCGDQVCICTTKKVKELEKYWKLVRYVKGQDGW